MANRKKQITLTVVVSGPSWMTKAQAKREVRTLINDQAFWGSCKPGTLMEDLGPDNFRARVVS